VELAQSYETIGLTWVHSEPAVTSAAAEVRSRGALPVVARMDLLEVERVPEIVNAMLEEIGPVGALVNNAAMPFSEDFLHCQAGEVRRVFDVNFFGPFLLTQLVAENMIKHGTAGVVVNVTSVQENRVKTGSTVYACAKAALAQLTRSAAVELAPYGIRVAAVVPGEIATGMSAQTEAGVSVHRPNIPLGRSGSAEEVADVIRFLCSSDAGYITGAGVVCDGGLTLSLPPE
jgi:NAD(P)-dependent dehydrogenase (short-subunit alcohol dehydrogenase family)